MAELQIIMYTQQIKIYMGHNMKKCTFRQFFDY